MSFECFLDGGDLRKVCLVSYLPELFLRQAEGGKVADFCVRVLILGCTGDGQ